MSKGGLGLLLAFWPKGPARYPHVPYERVTRGCVERIATAEADRPALVVGARELRFDELAERLRVRAAALRARVPSAGRVAIVLDDPFELVVTLLGAFEADLLAWSTAGAVDPATLARFAPDLIVASAPLPVGDTPAPILDPATLRGVGNADEPGRPPLHDPILAFPRPHGGEVLHNHRTLYAGAVALGSFYLLEPGASLVLLEPPRDWLSLAALLGAWHKGATVHAAWASAESVPRGRVDYVVVGQRAAEARLLARGAASWPGRIGVGAIVGVEGTLSASRRRRLARRLRAPVLTVFGRNDLGPILASHPTWFLDEAVGIPMPDVDLHPLDPADGRALDIGWEAVEEAEMGVRATLTPAGGERVGRWVRTHWLAHVDPTGLYFLRGPVGGHDVHG